PIGYVRWTERRNMQEFLRLVATGQVTPSRLTSHRFDLAEAERAYAIVTGEDRQPFLGVILSYPQDASAGGRTVLLRPAAPSGKIGLGVIGAGNFAKAVLLPRIAKVGVDLVGVSTATGASARTTGDKFGFGYCTTDTDKLLADPAVHAVVIATRHGSHAGQTARALRAGKAVFVEKPLALDEEGLREVLQAQAETGGVLAVGFNRRFSPLVEQMKQAFAPNAPLAMTYRINAGPIPPTSWIHDPEQGGGRIIGEVCHFVDLVQHVADDEVTEVFALNAGGHAAPLHDVVTVSLRMRNGSIASISYFSTGDKSYPKERLEVFGGGAIAVLDDFRELTISRNGKRKSVKKLSQDKGFDEEIAAFLAAVKGGAMPIPLRSLVATTRATFAIEQSLATGQPVPVDADARPAEG
ncbi:Gfo/Idh/MocA family protein, partial [Longimicrobium sp.]|uniref:Gfo/Idh/MocA family protein n=1 Tax=Longimicrobium sp. TaxID=2029185 RepID=UPI002E2FB975